MKSAMTLIVLVIGTGCVCAQEQETGAVRDALAVQRARTEHGKGITDKKFYTREWNLDSLAPYAPQQKVSGTIRIWGNDVLTRGRLLEFWTEGFRKFQPDAAIDFRLT